MKIENIKNKKTQTLQEVAYDWGIDYQTFLVKMDMVNTIQEYCIEKKISQRKLAYMVPGLTQDRVSKIFSGQVGSMTIDKMMQILSALHIKITLFAEAA